MGTITTTDGTEIYYKDWSSGQPIVFSHGWPLTGAATDSPARSAMATTWTTTPTTLRR
jgi:pimeloyl-ACP methyl ester carboxylesterase